MLPTKKVEPWVSPYENAYPPVEDSAPMPMPDPVMVNAIAQEIKNRLQVELIDRLLAPVIKFFQLPEDAKALFLALLREPTREDILSIFADWLEEMGWKEAKKVRKVADEAK